MSLRERAQTRTSDPRVWSTLLLAWLMTAFLAGLAACGGVQELEEQTAPLEAVEGERFGLVVLNYASDRDDFRIRDQLMGLAWFVEHAEYTRDDVLSLLNVPLVSYLEGHPPTGGDACELHVSQVPTGAMVDEAEGWVYFMDAGEISVESGRYGLVLDSLYYPDVLPSVSGLVYDGSVRNGRRLVSRPELTIVGHGSGEVGDFAVTMTPPEAPRLAAIGEGAVRGSRVVGAAPGQPLRVVWTRGREAGGPVVVEYVRQGFDRVARLVCSADDDGELLLSSELLDTLPDFGPDQTDRIAVSRYALEAFEADGLSQGQALIVATDSVIVDPGR